MKDAFIILSLVALVYMLVWWASQPNAIAQEQAKTAAAEQRAMVYATRLAAYPTATPRPCTYYYQNYGYGC